MVHIPHEKGGSQGKLGWKHLKTVFSKLQYCSTVWSNTSSSNIDKLQKVQNFAGRIILGLRKYDHISDGLRSLKWLPIREKLILNDATMMHKCINKLVPDYLADMFKSRSQVHNRQTRSSGALDIPLCRLSTGQRSFAFRGAKLWNSLNDNIKSLKCPRNFRRHLANVLLSWYIFCNYNIIVLTFLINLYKFVFFILLSWKAH